MNLDFSTDFIKAEQRRSRERAQDWKEERELAVKTLHPIVKDLADGLVDLYRRDIDDGFGELMSSILRSPWGNAIISDHGEWGSTRGWRHILAIKRPLVASRAKRGWWRDADYLVDEALRIAWSPNGAFGVFVSNRLLENTPEIELGVFLRDGVDFLRRPRIDRVVIELTRPAP